MPQVAADPTTSYEALKHKISQAADIQEVWRLMREWRKKRHYAVSAAAEATPYWDDGLILAMLDRPGLLASALNNPTWPTAANKVVVSWSIQSLRSESTKDVLDAAAEQLGLLSQQGHFSGQSDAALDLTQSIDGRRSMAYRQACAAFVLLRCADLPLERFDHIATAVLRGNVPHQAQYSFDLGKLMKLMLDHPMTTKAWVEQWLASVPVGDNDIAFNHMLGATRWSHMVRKGAFQTSARRIRR